MDLWEAIERTAVEALREALDSNDRGQIVSVLQLLAVANSRDPSAANIPFDVLETGQLKRLAHAAVTAYPADG